MKEFKPNAEDDSYVFALQDRNGRFSISLADILKCILKAEKQGILPGLPAEQKNRLREIAGYEGDTL